MHLVFRACLAPQALTKVMAGQVTMFPAYVVAFYLYMATLEGKSLPESVEKLRGRFVQTYAVGTAFWPGERGSGCNGYAMIEKLFRVQD